MIKKENMKTGAGQNIGAEDVAYIGLGAALIAVCSWISIPTAVPFTLQTFAVFLLLALLGGKRGTVAIAVYLLLGLAGLPVFAGFKGGPAALIGPTGGYIISFLFAGIIYIAVTGLFGEGKKAVAAALLAGLAVCYIAGTLWFVRVYSDTNGPVTVAAALSWCVFPFVIPDLVKMGLAMVLSARIKKVIAVQKTVRAADQR